MHAKTNEVVITLQDVSFSYGDRPVLENVNLTVQRGDFLALIGPNGGGKTTLVKLMLGLLKPHNGSVCVLGERPGAASRKIGYVPQYVTPRPGFPITVLDAARMGLSRDLVRKTAQGKAKAMDALGRVGMQDHADRLFGELSGGQRQRALIARALASDAEVLLLDEPTASIDPHGSFCFFDFLCATGEEQGLTVVLVSHDLNVLSTRVKAVACVNLQLVASRGPNLSREMLELLYGRHEHSCVMEDHLSDLSQRYGADKTLANNHEGHHHG